MPRTTAFLCVVGALTIGATSSHAFDQHRTGFVLGFGVGPSVTSFTQELSAGGESATSPRESKAGVATDFRIGFGANEKLSLYYVNRVSWISFTNVYNSSVTIANSTGLLGASYYFQKTAPSPYLLGLVGLSSWSAPFESNAGSMTGFGLGLGAGYEFAPHWSLEVNANFGSPSDEAQGLKATTHALSVNFTVNAFAY